MNAIQSFSFNNIPVSFRDDGYLNATAVAAHFSKLPKDFLKNEQTQEYIAALADNLSKRRKILLDKNQLVIVKHGGNNRGTWLHPKLAIHFARWLDPKFAVWCDEQIEQILSGSPNPKTTVDDRTGLRQAVSALVGRCGIDYSSAYNMVHQRFGVAAIEDIPAEKLSDAVQYVHTITLCSGINGEVLDRLPENLQPKPLRNLQGAVINSLYCAEFIYQHRLALRGLNRRLAATLNDHAADSIMFLRNVAEQAGINVPDNEYFQYFPWDGDSAEKASYHQLNA
ncbi:MULTISPECIES: KilA-N domain-containing protein [Eikenella]|uniref:KilA-N domain-containing protein n=1 Tax=Eikenella exigua TaxID=2528037 RepID=A0AAX1F884_9NEIS|nr:MULTISPECIES: KilA-N domain-containing protein [Eikenella]QED92282.1 KilA-N domain-containing protein [Eikenella exigua]